MYIDPDFERELHREAQWQDSADAREAAFCEAAGRVIVIGWIALIVGLAGWMVM